MPLQPGLTGVAEILVGESDTATAMGSGDVPVLGTPRLLALAEQATVRAVAGALEPGTTTVGYRVHLEHRSPTALGEKVRAEAVLEAVEGTTLSFRVAVNDGRGPVGHGSITRVVVNRDRFLARLQG
jgi:fluoroacetyl-CoA thioesterase